MPRRPQRRRADPAPYLLGAQGLDDHWQNCTRTCSNGTVIPSWRTHNNFDYQGCDNNTGSWATPWYDDDGAPQVDEHRFPDLKGMNAKAHQLGLRVGWYFGNYQCRDAMCRGPGCKGPGKDKPPWDKEKLVAGSVKAVAEYGFDSVKLDSGFPITQNLSLWAQLLNETGRPVMIENCRECSNGRLGLWLLPTLTVDRCCEQTRVAWARGCPRASTL